VGHYTDLFRGNPESRPLTGIRLYAARIFSSLGIAVMACIASGCAGAHLYSSSNDSLAQSAKASFAKTDFDAIEKTRRANLALLQERDISLAEQTADIRRDQAIQAQIDPPSGSVTWQNLGDALDQVDTELGTDTTYRLPEKNHAAAPAHAKPGMLGAIDVNKDELEVESARDALSASGTGFKYEWGLDAPPCDSQRVLPDWSDNKPPTLPATLSDVLNKLEKGKDKDKIRSLQLTFEDYRAKCATLLSAQETEDHLCASLSDNVDTYSIPGLYRALLKARVAYETAVREATDANNEFAKIQADIKAATINRPGKTIAEQAATAEGKVKSAVSGLESAGTAVGLGKLYASKARLDAVNTFVSELSSSSSTTSAPTIGSSTQLLTPNVAAAAQVIKTIPSLADQVVAINTTLSAPPLSALLIERARQQALIDQSQRTVTRAQQRLLLLQAALADRIKEMREIRNARLDMQEGNSTAASLSNPAFLKSLDDYSRGFYVGTRATYLLGPSLVDLEEQASADEAEYAIESYRAVLSTPLDQFAAWEAAGIKPADLAKLLADIASAAGVNVIAGKI
jgi:hypothetical protein